MRRVLIAGNFKMQKMVWEVLEYMRGLVLAYQEGRIAKDRDVLICPAFPALSESAKIIEGTPIYLGGQNMHFEEWGAFTGEVSPRMLHDLGCNFVIVGHSERRYLFGEKEDWIHYKVIKGLEIGLKVILCVGELLKDRQEGREKMVVEAQLERGLKKLDSSLIHGLSVAYEPVWAIGTGRTARSQDAESMHAFIREKVKNLYNQKIAQELTIIYGGSVKAENIEDLMSKENVDGVLVGSGCLDLNHFLKIIHFRDSKMGSEL